MNICIYGAGAIGSLFGALLSKENNVSIIARKDHVHEITKNGLIISGKTTFHQKLSAYESIQDLKEKPDLLFLTVKSYDTKEAVQIIHQYLSKNTSILSFQNGLTNVDCLLKYFDKNQIIIGITSHGAIFHQPGTITHTGIGNTKIGELNGSITKRVIQISDILDHAQIKNEISSEIQKEIWIKGIINSSINPVTAIFQ